MDLAAVQAAASASATALHEAHRTRPSGAAATAEREAAIDTLSRQLRREQALVARALGGTLYEVRPQETLSAIAVRYYGNANLWPRIVEANAHLLDNPDQILPGMTLVLP